jgi:hypothetical protein
MNFVSLLFDDDDGSKNRHLLESTLCGNHRVIIFVSWACKEVKRDAHKFVCGKYDDIRSESQFYAHAALHHRLSSQFT